MHESPLSATGPSASTATRRIRNPDAIIAALAKLKDDVAALIAANP